MKLDQIEITTIRDGDLLIVARKPYKVMIGNNPSNGSESFYAKDHRIGLNCTGKNTEDLKCKIEHYISSIYFQYIFSYDPLTFRGQEIAPRLRRLFVHVDLSIWWVIKNADGEIIAGSNQRTAAGARSWVCGVFFKWTNLYKRGYRCVRVSITEAK